MFGSYRDNTTPPQKENRKSSRIVLLKNTGKHALERSRKRLVLVGLGFVICFGAVSVRLVEVAVIRGMRSGEEAALATYRANKPKYPRADIVDRNGVMLATTLRTASLYAKPDQIRHPIEVAEELAAILPGINEKELAKGLSSGRSFMWVRRHLTPKQQQQVHNLGEPGLVFEPEFKRIYPHKGLFSHALGYVDVDAKGIAGVEKHFENYLHNDEGDAAPLVLSLDMRIQAILREELQKAVADFSGIGAAGIVLDIRKGELLSLVSLPEFDPHDPGYADPDHIFNRATVGTYEMGSTFKTFTMALGLESGVVNLQSGYDASKPIRIARHTINDDHPKNRWLSVPEIFAYSSNIGTARMIMDIGVERQRAFLKALGLFEPVSIELPETATPQLPSQWSTVSSMTVSFGHGISVTPLHLARAVASLAGNGALLPVTLVKGGNDGKEAGEPLLSPANVVNIRKLLRLVVEHGTGSKANAAGYRVGGKTGTAEKLKNGRYSRDSRLASFVGIFPAEDPRYVVLAMVDEPKGIKRTYGFAGGGWVAAPVVNNVISRMGPMMGLRPIYDLPSKKQNDPKHWVFYDGGSVHAVSF